MTITTGLSICGIAVFAAYEIILRRRDLETASWRGDGDDRSTTRLVLIAYAVVVAVNIALAGSSIGAVGVGWRWAGVAMIVVGLALRAWAMATLGRYYTRTLRTVDDQHVVDHGPYSVVRHPGYSGSLLIWIGYALGLGNWVAAALTLSLLGAVYVWRINAEEVLLRASLGPEYIDYQRHTKRMIPFLY